VLAALATLAAPVITAMFEGVAGVELLSVFTLPAALGASGASVDLCIGLKKTIGGEKTDALKALGLHFSAGTRCVSVFVYPTTDRVSSLVGGGRRSRRKSGKRAKGLSGFRFIRRARVVWPAIYLNFESYSYSPRARNSVAITFGL